MPPASSGAGHRDRRGQRQSGRSPPAQGERRSQGLPAPGAQNAGWGPGSRSEVGNHTAEAAPLPRLWGLPQRGMCCSRPSLWVAKAHARLCRGAGWGAASCHSSQMRVCSRHPNGGPEESDHKRERPGCLTSSPRGGHTGDPGRTSAARGRMKPHCAGRQGDISGNDPWSNSPGGSFPAPGPGPPPGHLPPEASWFPDRTHCSPLPSWGERSARRK